MSRKNVTISISRDLLRKAKAVAARRNTSISHLLAQEIERLVGQEEAYQKAEQEAVNLLNRGLHLGGTSAVSRDEVHER